MASKKSNKDSYYFQRKPSKGYIQNSFCEGDFRLTEIDKIMYRAYGRLFKKLKLSEKDKAA
jgi:hypothetical protein